MRLLKKSKVEVFVSDESKEQIRQKAKNLGISMAEVIKRALEKFLHEN